MVIKHEKIDTLPQNAWLLDSNNNLTNIVVYHGKGVIRGADHIFEGCHSGEGDQFWESESVFGSGVRFDGDTIMVVPSSHSMESLYALKAGNAISISNSLAFLVACKNIEIKWNPDYTRRFATAVRGIDDHEKIMIDCGAQGIIMRFMISNVVITKDLELLHQRKATPRAFHDFKDYTAYLDREIGKLLENVSDVARPIKYHPLLTCSKGYDSPAIAAMAVRFGVRDALTLKISRQGIDDSGKTIGKILGLSVMELDRLDQVDGDLDDYAEFTATGYGGEDICYRHFGPFLNEKVLITAFRGGKIWSLGPPNDNMSNNDVSGHSLQEYRLWKNFIHMDASSIGSIHHSCLHRISTSDEMTPWILHDNYDKPIARRIVEEAGVSRELFGQTKNAASLLVFSDEKLLSRSLRKQINRNAGLMTRMKARVGFSRMNWEFRYALYRLFRGRLAGIPFSRNIVRFIVPDWRVFEHSHPVSSLHFIVGLNLMKKRYKNIISGSN